MDQETLRRKKELEFLIGAWGRQAERGNLSDKGLEYLAGLKKAYDILFPMQITDGNKCIEKGCEEEIACKHCKKCQKHHDADVGKG